ncbi:DUF2306 domain-containing protein [Fulvivirgaceae bacterium BMA10]|uniref:DUF2306 domain-containing protein n=1 Tax=Splendidivirga corallicola TaxID=3051826 RepID=A0ABT8KXF3_9BACT|nr:DUF2306 domain-containing protein [Fulvivirgaceae bacterium BMA10]
MDTNVKTSITKPVLANGLKFSAAAGKALNLAGSFWFLVAIAGQWIFTYYVMALYGGSTIQGNLEVWGDVLPHGIMEGDPMGNAALAGHLFLAILIMGLGPLQFIPYIRNHARKFHRLNGRMYLLAVVVTSIAGLYMIWTRGTVGGLIMHVGISLDAVLILLFAYLAWRYAVARQIKIHRRWALRLFIVVSGVWFFRVGLMLWILLNKGPVGFDPETFQGPFLSFWTFGQYLVPLAILELYLFTRDKGSAVGRFAMAGALLVLTFAMGIGIFGATMGLWLPRI